MKNRGGFTIIETLITLAVSSALFVTVMVMFSGRQGRVEFAQGMRDIESHIRDVSNDVRNGYYPAVTSQKCTKNADNTLGFSASASVQGKGTNNDCIFAGKVMLFDISSDDISTYSLAGLKTATNTSTLNPILAGSDGKETLQTYKIPAGIKLIKVDVGGISNISAALAILFNLDNSAANGVTSVLPYKIKGSSINNIKDQIKKSFSSVGSTASALDAGGLTLCFNSATSNQRGTILVNKGIDGITMTTTVGVVLNSSSGCWDGQ